MNRSTRQFLLLRTLLGGFLLMSALVAGWTALAGPARPSFSRHPAVLSAKARAGAAPRAWTARVGSVSARTAPMGAARGDATRHDQDAPGLPFILHSFDGSLNDGSNPDAGPLLYVPSLGTIFGTTTGSSGTAQSTTGTVFSFAAAPNGAFQTLATSVGLLNNGLAFGTDSGGAASLFGTNQNGTTPYGEVFGLRLSDNAVSTVRVFDDQQPLFPVAPQAGTVAAPDGYLYGTTRYEYKNDGTYDTTTFGVLYRFKPGDPNGTFEILHRFASNDAEGYPMKGAPPLAASNNVIYGVTNKARFVSFGNGSVYQPGEGAIYAYDPNVTDPAQRFKILANLNDETIGEFSLNSQSGLVQAGDGFLYGVTSEGGANEYGTVYRFNPADNSVSVQYNFDDNPVGYAAIAGLTVGADGNLYGTTTLVYSTNGIFNGSVFRLRPDGSGNYTQTDVLHFFAPSSGGTDYGEGRCQDPLIEVNHVLFGTCRQGGAHNDGLIFQVSDDLTAAPTITPPVGYQRNANGTANVTINGTNFVAGCSINITNTYSGTTLSATFVSDTQLTAGLSLALPGGDHVVTVTNPDGQSATATLTTPYAPTITPPVGYMAHPNGSSTVTINGTHFQTGSTAVISGIYDDSNPQVHYVSAAQLTVELSDIVSAGDHTVTVTNPDDQTATATLTVSGPPVISDVIYHANGDGTSYILVNGTNFVRGADLSITHFYVGTTLDSTLQGTGRTGTQIRGDLNKLLPPGSHTVTLTNPDGQSATATFTTTDAPTITPPIGYQKNGDGTATLTINGTGFQAFCAVTVSPSPAGAAYPVQDFSPTQLSVQSPVLSPGDYTVTVTNPDGQSAAATLTIAALSQPHITHLAYTAHADGSSDLTVDGTNFVDTPSVNVTKVASGTQLRLTSFSPTRLVVHLNTILPAGFHTVKVTNPDGQSASSTLVTYGKPRVDGAIAIAQQGGDVYLVVSGAGFQPGGLNGDIGGATVIVRGPHGQVVPDAQVVGGPGFITNIGTDLQQYIVDLGTPANSLNYSVEVVNPDGETSDPSAVSDRARPRASSPPSRFNVYTSNHTEYQVSWFEQVLQFLHLSFLLNPSSGASPTQLLPGDVSLLDQHPCLVTPTGPGSIAMGLIGQDGNGIVAQGGGNAFPVTGLLGPVGAAAARPGQEDIVAQGGGNLVNTNGSNIVAQGGGNIVAQGGGNLIGQDGNGLIGQDGNGLIGQDGNGLIGQDGNGIVAQGGGNLTGRLRAGDLSTTPSVSFTLGRYDEGTENGTGPTDAQVIGTGPDGSDVLILSIRYTPGQPDVITYAAPGVVLTPTGDTPAPQVINPVPTLTALSPDAVTAGSGAFTLTVTGTLFTDGTTIVWNGRALSTTVVSGTRLTAQVPAMLVTQAGTAQVTVVNPAPGGGASNAATLTVRAAPPVRHTYPAGLQMFCAPADFSGVSLGAALAPAPARALTWDPAALQYADAGSLAPGRGYWARFTADTALYALGAPTATGGPFAVALKHGWNMIGDPFPAPVSLTTVRVQDAAGKTYGLSDASKAGLVAYTVYGFPAGSARYQAQDGSGTLSPYEGYWLYAFKDCTLQVSAP